MSQETGPDLVEQGRTDPPHALRDRLASAPPLYAEGALSNPALDPRLMEVMLRNPGLPEAFLQRVGGDRRFLRYDAVKRALVMHPSTPQALSMHLVKFLDWRDLVRLSSDTRLSPPRRAQAERLLGDRLGKLPVPEKARLARTAGRGVIAALLRSRNVQIVQQLMRNPRLTERDVFAIARDENAPSNVLCTIARDEKWSCRRPVRLVLVQNIATPLPEALRLLEGLLASDLQEISRNARLRPPLRNEAARLLLVRRQPR